MALGADEPGDLGAELDEARQRLGVDLVARSRDVDGEVGDHARRRLRQHDHTVGEVHALVDVVGDEQDRLAPRRPHRQQHVLERGPGLGVDRRVRLVHQQERRAIGERAGDRDPLLHAARELARVLLGVRLEPDVGERLLDPLGPFGLVEPGVAQREVDVGPHLQPRIERPAVVLEHQREVLGNRR